MQVPITYVYHSCFCMKLGDSTLVFDYPGHTHRNAQSESVVAKALLGAAAYVFFSHSHHDHCSPEIIPLASKAASVRYVLSYDVPDMIPEFDIENAVVVEPEEEYQVDDLKITCLDSNDLGVAFMIQAPGVRVYYGGDLAEWTWPNLDEKSKALVEQYFGECLDQIKAFGLDIAFSNVDKRLPNLGGAARFLDHVRPRFFVPMHAFGNTASIAEFANSLNAPDTELFVYENTGDQVVLEV